MVHGLIRYHKLGQAVLLLKGFKEDFAFTKTDKQSMAEWNPLLLAVAFKRLEIVRYFVHELRLPIRIAGNKSGQNYGEQEEDLITNEMFALTLAITNKDTNMLQELWTVNSSAWEENHLHRLLKQLIAAKWTQGL
jgi:hypothetical protein